MGRLFIRWLGAVDPAFRVAMRGSLLPWLGTAVAALLVIAVAGVFPGTSRYFSLAVGPALGIWAVTFGFGIGAAWLDRRFDLSSTLYGLAFLASGGLVLLLCASLPALSRLPGSTVLAAVFILAAGFYGHLHLSSLRYPFGLIVLLGALAGASWLGRGGEGRMILVVAGPIAIGGNWLLGTLAWRAHRARVESASLKAAVQAQILEERSRHLSRLSGAMLRVLQTTHDASNALSTALINAEMLRKANEARRRGEPAQVDETETAEELTGQLLRLRRLVEETRDVGHRGEDRSEAPQVVAPLPLMSDVLRQLRVRFPQVEMRSSGSAAAVGVVVRGGAGTLHRVLENLVLNACQGDGQHGARRVEVTLEEAATVGSVAIRVLDDGPGFSAQHLAAPITGFQSTKPDGTGLGLYTAERLVRASGGSLTRENLAGGGAAVTVFLRSADPE